MSVAKLRDLILPTAFNKDGTQFVECEMNSEIEGKEQFQSNVVFLTVTVKKKDEKVKLPLVVKFEPLYLGSRKYFHSNVQFYNEVLMYSRVLPFINKLNIVEDTFAKFYHGVGVIEDTDRNVVIVEDLSPSGYRLTEGRGFMDYDHLSLAISKLGRFHALSYAAKEESADEFFDLAKRIEEAMWFEEFQFLPALKFLYHRAIDPLIKRGKHVKILQRLLDRVESDVFNFLAELRNPEEPIAVICHGDFCRNNMLFKYGDDGTPVHVKFFDLGTSKYTSPAMDIVVLFFLNASSEIRRAHWDDLLEIYHRSLCDTIPGTEVPSLDDIKKEVLQKAMYAFNVCTYFLPMMLFDMPFKSLDFVPDTSLMENVRIFSGIGGAEGTEVLSNLMEELIDRGCLTMDHKFMVSSF